MRIVASSAMTSGASGAAIATKASETPRSLEISPATGSDWSGLPVTEA